MVYDNMKSFPILSGNKARLVSCFFFPAHSERLLPHVNKEQHSVEQWVDSILTDTIGKLSLYSWLNKYQAALWRNGFVMSVNNPHSIPKKLAIAPGEPLAGITSLSSIGQDSRFCLVDSYTFWNAKWVSTTSSKQPCSHIWLVASFILYCYTQPSSLAQHVPSILSIGDYKVHLWTLSRVLSRPKGILSIQHCLKVSSSSEWCLIKQLMGSTFLLRLKMIGSMLFLFPSWLQPTCLSNRHCDTYRCRLLYKWYASLLSMTKHKIICIADEHYGYYCHESSRRHPCWHCVIQDPIYHPPSTKLQEKIHPKL